MSNLIKTQNEKISNQKLLSTLRESIYPGAKDESIQMVVSYCAVRGLDCLLKPVHIVSLNVKNSKNEYEWRDVVMPGIGLYRIQASRSNQYAGVSEPEFGETIKETIDGVEVSYPLWCKVTVKKIVGNHIVDFAAKEYWKENYAIKGMKSNAPNLIWQKRSFGQLAKCAEAQALRKAFPEFIPHQPIAEEMAGKTLNELEYTDLTPDIETKTELQENIESVKRLNNLSKEEQKKSILNQISQQSGLINQFMELCRENALDVKDFATFAKVNRSNTKTIETAIDNFDDLKKSFLEAQNATAH